MVSVTLPAFSKVDCESMTFISAENTGRSQLGSNRAWAEVVVIRAVSANKVLRVFIVGASRSVGPLTQVLWERAWGEFF